MEKNKLTEKDLDEAQKAVHELIDKHLSLRIANDAIIYGLAKELAIRLASDAILNPKHGKEMIGNTINFIREFAINVSNSRREEAINFALDKYNERKKNNKTE